MSAIEAKSGSTISSHSRVTALVDRLLWVSTLAFIFVLPWRATISFEFIGGRTIGVLTGFTMLSLFILQKLLNPRIRQLHTVHILTTILVIMTILSMLWSIDSGSTASALIRPVLVIGMLVIMWDLFRNLSDILKSMKWYVFGCYILSSMVLFEFLFGSEAITSYGSARYVGVGAAAPNILATMVVFGVTLSWFLYTKKNTPGFHKETLLYVGYVPLGIFTVFLTGSRHGFIILMVALIYVGVSFIKKQDRSTLFSGFLIGAGTIVTYLYSPGVNRIATIPEEIVYGDLNNRLYLWQESLLLTAENPLTGVGFDAFHTVAGASPHNGFLSVLVGLGFIGLLVYVLIHIQVIRAAMSSKQGIRFFSCMLFTTILFAHAAQSIVYNPIIWFLMNSIILLYYIGEDEKTVTAGARSVE